MKKIFILLFILLQFVNAQNAHCDEPGIKQSYFKLTTSNGMVVAVYNAAENRIDDVYPHIFTNYDSAHYVFPFAGNIKLNGKEKPIAESYVKNTHVINVKYPRFEINYFSSFTRNDCVFYAVIRGEKSQIEHLSFDAELTEGQPVSGISQLENSLQDLPIQIKGKALTGNVMRKYNKNLYEKYFLFSYSDSLVDNSGIIEKTIAAISKSKTSLVDHEVEYMQGVFARCKLPAGISAKEKNIVEQSVSILKMSQVSDFEIFPRSHGQILASLRPGLWHTAWVRDGSFAIEALTRLGMYQEAKKGLEFMLKAPSGKYKHFVYKDGVDYGPGVDYQISLTRYFGNGEEECDWNDDGPNIEYDDFGLFMTAFCDYVTRSNDAEFYKKWNSLMCTKVAGATIASIAPDSLIKADSGPWEHHLKMPRQYTFTSGVCARGLELFAGLQKQFGFPYEKYENAAKILKQGIFKHMLCDGDYFKGNSEDRNKTDHEYFDSGVYEIFANGLITDKSLFLSHMDACDPFLRIKGERPGYIRLNSNDPYENQEWIFIDLRISVARMLFGQKGEAKKLINYVTNQAALNYNTIPEMISNKLQMEKVPEDSYVWNIWCNCIRHEDDMYIGTIPMVGYGSGAYVIALYKYYGM
jgi:Glucoamylase and related glycosyl hydrolases